VTIKAPRRHVVQLFGELGRRESPVTEECLHDSETDGVQAEICACHTRILEHC